MSNTIIISLLDGLLIPARLLEIISYYLLSLMIPSNKHTLKFAEQISGKANSLFSNLLIQHLGLSTIVLNRAGSRRLTKLMKIRKPLSDDAPWTIAIIIDSTLHERSSDKVQNSQKMTHGKGWITGHQWTNIGILINGQYVPLPPIPFYTKDECKRRKIEYKTESQKIATFLKNLSLKNLLGSFDNSEVVVITDSGYDSNIVLKAILSKKIDFVASIKSSRCIFFDKKNTPNVSDYFTDGRRPWKTIKLRVDSGKRKWRCYATKRLEASLQGIVHALTLICSKRSDGKMKFLACSNQKIDTKGIVATYQLRWAIENFHRAIKSYLGLEDASSHCFDTLHAHVHWVYCAYILLHDFNDDPAIGIKMKQDLLISKLEIEKINKIVQKNTQCHGNQKVKDYCLSVIAANRRAYRYG